MDFLMDFTSSGSSELGGDLQKNGLSFCVLGVPSSAETSRKMAAAQRAAAAYGPGPDPDPGPDPGPGPNH